MIGYLDCLTPLQVLRMWTSFRRYTADKGAHAFELRFVFDEKQVSTHLLEDAKELKN